MIAKTTLAGIRTTLRIHVKEGCVKVADLPTCTAHRQRYSMGDRKRIWGFLWPWKASWFFSLNAEWWCDCTLFQSYIFCLKNLFCSKLANKISRPRLMRKMQCNDDLWTKKLLWAGCATFFFFSSCIEHPVNQDSISSFWVRLTARSWCGPSSKS